MIYGSEKVFSPQVYVNSCPQQGLGSHLCTVLRNVFASVVSI